MTLPARDHSGLVVGAGSIGSRHLRNLRTLGITRLAACDPDAERRKGVAQESGVQTFADLQPALADFKPSLVFVCTPPVMHVAQARAAVAAGAHVLVEKPLSVDLEGVGALISEAAAGKRQVQVGYNLRFHPGAQRLKRLVEEGAVGRILWAYAEVGQYLPDWRPQQDYRRSYTARRALGGGIILDASHELDYVTWLLGLPAEVQCMAGKVSGLEVDVEDCATILLRFREGTRADVHMDFVQRGYNRSCKLAGEQGSVVWDYPANEVRLYRADRDAWETERLSCQPGDMYLAEVQDFLECVAQGRAPRVDLLQAKRVLEIALAAKRAAERGAVERMTWTT